MEYKYPNNIKVVGPRPGVFVLDGKLKIEKYDELNYVIKIKDCNCKDKVKNDNKKKKTYIYKSDGYKRYGNSYFPSISRSLEYIVDRVIPALALDEVSSLKNSIELVDYIEKINSFKEEIRSIADNKM